MGDQPSKWTKDQKRKYGPAPYERDGYGPGTVIRATVRFDDECGNGHNSFSITGSISPNGSSGCIHEAIVVAFPELAPFIKWHLCSTDGPIHGVANAVYHAGARDHWGLLKDEKRQLMFGGKVPCWQRVMRNEKGEVVTSASYGDDPGQLHSPEKPTELLTAAWEPHWKSPGEGKERDLDAARGAAVWLDATDEELTAPGLEERLKARLPALLAEFRRDVESLGFTW